MAGLTLERTALNVARVTREFSATPNQVFEAHVNPDLLRQWLVGPEGWTMTECINDARIGGAIRYVWHEAASGHGFHLTGRFLAIERPNLILHVEQMHLPDPTPENRVETRFSASGKGTLMVMTMTLPDAATLGAMLATGMTGGMETSYQRLEASFPFKR